MFFPFRSMRRFGPIAPPAQEEPDTPTREVRSAPPVEQRIKQVRRRFRLGTFLFGVVLVLWCVPLTSSQVGFGAGFGLWATVNPTCGHPKDVIPKLLKGFTYTMPTKQQLELLPTPKQKHITQPSDATYDPAKDQLCVGSWVALDIRYANPQPTVSGSTNYDPNYGFTGTTVDTAWNSLWNGLLQGVHSFLKSILDWLSPYGFLFYTPPEITYGNTTIQNLVTWSVGAIDSGLGLFLVIGGYNYLFGEYQDFREVAPRLVVPAIAANFSLPVLGQFIDLNNALCSGFRGVLATAGRGTLSLPLGALNWATLPEYLLVAYLVVLVGAVLLSLQMLERIVLLDLLLVWAPFGLMCFALPQTRRWGVLWAQAIASVISVQFLQLSAVGLGAVLIASFGHPINNVIPLDANSNLMVIFVGLATELLAWKIPDWLLSSVMRTNGGGSTLGKTLTTIVQTATEMGMLAA